jgi:hypothetical protein
MYDEILIELSKSNAKYLVIGGVAIILSGYFRTTVDLDIFPELSEENLEKIITVVEKFGYVPRVPVKSRDLKNAEKRKDWIENKNMKVFSFIHPKEQLLTIDIMINPPIDFEEAYQRRQIVRIKDVDINVASIDDLIKLKKIASREQDKVDIAKLEVIKEKLENERNR